MSRTESILEDLAAERAITRVLAEYFRGVDRGDLALARGCFHDDAIDDHGIYHGPIDGLFALAGDARPPYDTMRSTVHYLCNVMIDRRGDVAAVESYAIAYHGLEIDGEPQDELVGGRYLDRFERRDGVWKIAHRRCVFDWSRIAPGTARFHERLPGTFTLGARGRADALYALIESCVGPASR
jgi:hypothetical protein